MSSVRMSGLISGLDTDSLVKQLTAKYSAQKDKVWKQKETLKVKQDTWKDLNKEIVSFVNNTLSNSRFTSSYTQNSFSLSNPGIATVSGKNISGYQELNVKQIATNTYMTGGKIKQSYPIGIEGKFTITYCGIDKEIDITSDMSMDQVAKTLSEVGLSANFDEKNGRLFLASKMTGLNSDFIITGDAEVLDTIGLGSSAVKREGQDAKIELNGAEFTSEDNNFDINGMKITAQMEGKTLLTAQESSQVFDTIKEFVEKYNELIKKIDKLYGTKNAGYEPLTDDEKYSMSDRQIEEWEEKIKESALYKDEVLDSIRNTMKNNMSQSYNVNGKYYSLYRLGISTGNYFSTSEEERNVYNIDEDKLKKAITDDPNSVISFVTKLSNKLYDDLSRKMRSSSYNSAYTFYPDKQYKKNNTNYEDKLKKLEKDLADREDKLYSKFSKMESVLAKVQNRGNSLMNFFG